MTTSPGERVQTARESVLTGDSHNCCNLPLALKTTLAWVLSEITCQCQLTGSLENRVASAYAVRQQSIGGQMTANDSEWLDESHGWPYTAVIVMTTLTFASVVLSRQ